MCTKLGHNSVALPTSAGQREGDRICPALTETFMSLLGDLHSIGWRQMSLLLWGGVENPPGGAALHRAAFCPLFVWWGLGKSLLKNQGGHRKQKL